MATAKTTAKTTTTDTAERLKSAGRPFVEEAQRTGTVLIDAYETQVGTLTDFQTKVADVINVEPAASITSAYADLTRDLTAAQVSVARSLLRV
jgi:hypothetical protein